MLAANYSNVRENLKDYCDRVVDNETVIVTRKNREECCHHLPRRMERATEEDP